MMHIVRYKVLHTEPVIYSPVMNAVLLDFRIRRYNETGFGTLLLLS